MGHKYGLLIYDDAPSNAGNFDVVTQNEYVTYVNELLGSGTDKKGQKSYFFVESTTMVLVIVEDADWQQSHTDIINNSVDAWKAANPSIDIGAFQSIFDESDKTQIWTMLQNRRLEIINGY